MKALILCEVFRTPSGIVTVTTDDGDGSGVRLCGVKLTGSGSRKIAEFRIGRDAVDSLVEQMDEIEARVAKLEGGA